MSFGKPYIMEIEGCIHDGWLLIRDKNNVFDLKFLCHMLSTEYLLNQYKMFAAGSTVNNLNKELVGNASVRFPEMLEQNKIGKYLESLDHLITLHQSKPFGHILKVIASYTLYWEQRKAKELCTIGTGESNTQDQAEDGMYTFYIRSEIPVKSNKYLYDCEAVITIGDGNIGRVFHYVNGKFDLHQRCYKMTDFENVWGKYFYYFFSTRFYDRAMKMTAKATVDSVRIEMISEMYILKPAEINEQKNIADFFTHLDHLITLHQLEPFKLIFKAIAYRIIDYAKSKPPRYIKYADLN